MSKNVTEIKADASLCHEPLPPFLAEPLLLLERLGDSLSPRFLLLELLEGDLSLLPLPEPVYVYSMYTLHRHMLNQIFLY